MIAFIFKILFKFPFLKPRYYGFYKHIFLKYGLFKGKKVKALYDGDIRMSLDLDDFIQQQIYFLGYYDKAGILFLKKHLQSGGIMVDIGANIGCYTLMASKITGQNGKVFAFEPIQNINTRLLENIGLNGFKNIQVEKKAVFDRNTELKLNVSADANRGMSSIYKHDEESGIQETVSAITADTYFAGRQLPAIDLVKIDIEGAEIFALKGMKETLLRYKPLLMLEISESILSKAGLQQTEITALLNEWNYQIKGIDTKGHIVEMDHANLNDSDNFAFINLSNPAHRHLVK